MCQHILEELARQGSKPLQALADASPHAASSLCTAYEQQATSRTVAAAIKSLFDECVGVRCAACVEWPLLRSTHCCAHSLQLPLSEELIVSKTNFVSLDLVSAVLAQQTTLSSKASTVGPASCVLQRSSRYLVFTLSLAQTYITPYIQLQMA